jgi:hypothetical protein
MGNAVTDFFNDNPFQFKGEPKDAWRALCFIGAGVGLFLVTYGVVWLMAAWSVISGKGIIVAVLAPLLGGLLCLIGVVRFLVTTIRFRMYFALLLFALALTATAYGSFYYLHARSFEKARRAAVQAAFQGEKTLRPFVEIKDLRKVEGDPYLTGKLVILLDEETDYNGFPPPKLLRDLPFVDERPKKNMRPGSAKFHDLLFSLPVDLQAQTPEEVTTVIWVKGIKKVAGVYKQTGKSDGLSEDFPDYAYKYHATVMVIDRTVPAVVAVREILGPDAPKSKTSGGEDSGFLPVKEICEFLEGLPRR